MDKPRRKFQIVDDNQLKITYEDDDPSGITSIVWKISGDDLTRVVTFGDKDAGATGKDAGATDKDAVATDKDAGATDKDAGATDKDAGATDKDAGATDKDAGASDRTGQDTLADLVQNMKLKLKDDTPCGRVLDRPTLAAVAEYIKTDKCENIIVLVGAGISTSAGVPDFRNPGTGVFSTLAKSNLPSPQCMFEIDYFRRDPVPFYKFAKELFTKVLKPTACHFFVRLLNDKGKLLRLYTQNIDGLERVAGIPPEKLVEAHGTFSTSRCLNKRCRQRYDFEWLNDQVQSSDDPPVCGKCGAIVKPDVIFLGELLPYRFHNLVVEDFPRCDLLIVIGSSLKVAPFANLVDVVPASCPRLLINKKHCGKFLRGGLFNEKGGFNFDSDTNRDVLWISNCDDGCFALADALGYTDELYSLIDKELTKLAQ